MDQAFAHCEQRVREADKDRFLATLFAPAPHRAALYALYAFDLDVAHVRDRVSTALPGEVRLQWWRDVLTAAEAGEAAAHPVALALRATIERYALPASALVGLIDARTFDLYDDPMATAADFDAYARSTSAAVIGLAAQILNDGTSPGFADAIQHAGIAAALTGMLVQLPLHSARGQCYVPGDVLARHGAQLSDVYAGRATPALRNALMELRERARDHLAALRAIAPNIPEVLAPAFLPLALMPAILRRMERAGADPFRPQLPAQWRRQWTLWRAARRPATFLG